MHTLAPAEPDVREFEATVESVDGREVVLAETYFYAEAGGQPADRGTLDGHEVVDVQSTGDRVVHTLAEEPTVGAGDAATGVVDDVFRTYCMRAHTASHLLYGAARGLLDDLGYGGFGIRAEPGGERSDGGPPTVGGKVRVDFETSTEVTDELLVELERRVNRTVWDSRAVSWEEVPVEEARADDDVAFNAKTEEGVMADADAVRVVTVEGWDVAACGGTHVRNTREIGPVTVLDRSNPGEGLTRVEFAVGPDGIRRRADVHGAALGAARALGVAVDDLPGAVDRLRDERDRLAGEAADLREEVLTGRLRGLDAVERDGARWLVGTVEGFDANAVGEAAQSLVGANGEPDGAGGDGAEPESGAGAADVVAAVGGGDAPFVVVAAAGGPDAADAGDVVGRVTDEFGGGGGGSPAFAQGGGLDADPDEVAAFLRSG